MVADSGEVPPCRRAAVLRGLIDVHYGSVAEKALQQQHSDMHVPTEAEKEFED